MHGGAGDDTLKGSHSQDIIHGNGDSDLIIAIMGRTHCMEATATTPSTETGSRLVRGEGGNDLLHASAQGSSYQKSPDKIHGGPGNDTITGQGGKDTLEGGSDNDSINGGGNQDKIFGNRRRHPPWRLTK